MATVDSRQDTLDFEFLQGTLGEKDASSLKGSVDPISGHKFLLAIGSTLRVVIFLDSYNFCWPLPKSLQILDGSSISE